MTLAGTTIVSTQDRLSAAPEPLPSELQDGLDTIQFWVQTIGGSLAIIGLMVLFIGLFFANRHGRGSEFTEKAGWWCAGAIGLGTAAVIAPVFL